MSVAMGENRNSRATKRPEARFAAYNLMGAYCRWIVRDAVEDPGFRVEGDNRHRLGLLANTLEGAERATLPYHPPGKRIELRRKLSETTKGADLVSPEEENFQLALLQQCSGMDSEQLKTKLPIWIEALRSLGQIGLYLELEDHQQTAVMELDPVLHRMAHA